MDATDTIALIADEIIIAGGWRTRSITAIISRKVTRIWKTDYG